MTTIEILSELRSNYNCFDESEEPVYRALSGAIESLKQPERKNGKWNTYYHSDTEFTYSCNRCGYSAPYQVLGGEVVQKKWNFCPNCGADMRGDNDAEH